MNEKLYESAIVDGTCYIRLNGEARYTESSPFDHYVTKLVDNDEYDDLVFDLSRTTYMDSTNLGLIARLMVHLIEKNGKKAVIYCPNHNVAGILKSVGLDDFGSILTVNHSDEVDYSSLGPENTGRSMQKMMYEAHKILSELNENNNIMFKSVVELMREEQD